MNKQSLTIIYFFCLFLFFLPINSFTQNKKPSNTMNRKAVVAGQFYAGTKENLTKDLQTLFASAKKRQQDARAIISPHAGYVFSGEVAASAINQINPNKKYKNIFIIASSHTTYFQGASIYNAGNYETPLGEVKVNLEICNELIKSNKIFSFVPDAHKTEHSIEVQLPFLQYHLKNDFQIVPIVIGFDGAKNAELVAEALKPYWTEENIFIVSTDFSHYPNYNDAVNVDLSTANAIVTGKPEELIKVKNSQTGIKNLSTSCCAVNSVLVLMYLTEQKYSFNKIQYKNSGDSPYGSDDKVVGYWAISITEKNDSSFLLSDEDKIELLRLARLSAETKIKENKKLDVSNKKFSETLNEKCGAFVTFNKKSNLRGCIGRFEPNIPLYQVVIEMAVAAATEDYRFSPISEKELDEVEIEISVLTPFKKIKSIDEIELGKHGIYIIKNGRGGTFLPQVATSTGWSLEEFLGHCARDKAGIGYTGWKDADIYTYEAIVFEEKDFIKKKSKKRAKYYEKLEDGRINCTLCPHECIISEGNVGTCKTRQNINGELISLSYGHLVAINIDPIEKKPLYHFLPGSSSFSVGTAGCNLHCKNCQNSEISQSSPLQLKYIEATPEQVVATAKQHKCESISYTYTEPTIFYEFVLETAKLAKEAGIKNIIISNGHINPEPLKELIPYLDAANIDLKAFNDSIYKDITTASLKPILNNLKILRDSKIWLEITNLIIPKHTDDMKMISEMCQWLVENGFSETPLHFSRFFPAYKMQNVPPTPVETVVQAAEIAKSKGIKYVYLGNVHNEEGNTVCPKCGKTLITRKSYKIEAKDFTGKCENCKETINGVW
jgi:AmmeMemoRadiSam system radical SAM enzyme/AmmeMemoRadiSam system protein B/AmmeMemoRadiSam system protein A